MHEQEWRQVRHFKPNENWGDLDLLKSELVFRLDALRDFIGVPIIVHCAAESSGHRPNSEHYEGRAVDCHAEGISLAEFAFWAMGFRFTGIGVNVWWNNPGLHLDIKPLEPYQVSRRWIYWTHHKAEAGEKSPLDMSELAMCYCKALRDECRNLKLRMEIEEKTDPGMEVLKGGSDG